jgi:GDPmannose 4,6-dehydratase
LSKKAIIFGITGQDGAYLAHFLLKKNYHVIGVTRSKKIKKLQILNIKKKIIIKKINSFSEKNLFFFLKKNYCQEIYYFSGQSSVFKSFNKFDETFSSNVESFANVLEVIRRLNRSTKIFYSASSEMFGNKRNNYLTEKSSHEPMSPYALAKSISFDVAKIYRSMFGINVCSGILFNHESILRDNSYVIKKISYSVNKILKNNKNKVKLGNINISRDWGWAPEYVKIIWKILNNNKKMQDYIIATGKTTSLKKILDLFFKRHGLKWRNFVVSDLTFKRNNDIIKNRANISLLKKNLLISPKIKIEQIVEKFTKKELF